MDAVEEKLVRFVDSFAFGDIEAQVLHAIKLRFIDTIGCALAGYDEAPAKIARQLAAQVRSAEEAGVIGAAGKSSPEMAAFANTTMIRCLDLNDDYFGKDGPHPSDLIGAVLAASEMAHGNGASFVAAVAVAYEVLCTFVDAVGIRERGWDYVTYTSVAAALGAGKALGLTQGSVARCVEFGGDSELCFGTNPLGRTFDVEGHGVGQRLP